MRVPFSFFFLLLFSWSSYAVDCTNDLTLKDSVFKTLSNSISWYAYQPSKRDDITKLSCDTTAPATVPSGHLLRVEFQPREQKYRGFAICYLNEFRQGSPGAESCFHIEIYDPNSQNILPAFVKVN